MSRGSYHHCAVPGCGASIPRAFLMCKPHWSDVPRSVQSTVYATWKHGAGVRTAAYAAAARDAVTWVQAKQSRATTTTP